MKGRAFLDLALEVLRGRTEAHWRGTVIHAYYALLLECRDALLRWGRSPSRRDVHRQVRLTFSFARDPDLKQIGNALDELSPRRTHASYDMDPRSIFHNDGHARKLSRSAADALALLDALDADPARRTAAVASLPPPIP